MSAGANDDGGGQDDGINVLYTPSVREDFATRKDYETYLVEQAWYQVELVKKAPFTKEEDIVNLFAYNESLPTLTVLRRKVMVSKFLLLKMCEAVDGVETEDKYVSLMLKSLFSDFYMRTHKFQHDGEEGGHP